MHRIPSDGDELRAVDGDKIAFNREGKQETKRDEGIERLTHLTLKARKLRIAASCDLFQGRQFDGIRLGVGTEEGMQGLSEGLTT